MTTSIDRLVCGCIPGVAHWPDCLLGHAEQLAVTAATTAPAHAGPRLVIALAALAAAGLLRDPHPHHLVEDLHAVLDMLWEMGVLDRPGHGQVSGDGQ